jgi:hypothetical protein
MQTGNVAAVLGTLAAAVAAVERGAYAEAIGHLAVGKQQCVQLAAPSPAPPPRPPTALEPDEALDIHAVSLLTTYSVGRLRHMGHTLPGYKKWPNGKVTWWKRQLVAGIQREADDRRR